MMELSLYFSSLDGEILLWIQEYLRSDLLTPFWKVITTIGNGGAVWILLTIGLLICKQTRRVGVMCALSLVFTLVFTNLLIKPAVARIRPYEVIESLTILVSRPREYSFPSGHTSCSFAVAWVLFREFPKRAGVPALVLAIFVGFSRLYVGVHYPSDVLAGGILGILYATGAAYLFRKCFEKKV